LQLTDEASLISGILGAEARVGERRAVQV